MNCVEALPNPGKRPVTVARRFVAFVVRRGKRFLVRQRPAGVVNAHLWEFPNRETTANSTTPRVAAHRVLGASVEDPRPLLTVRHSITRYRILLEVFCGTTSTGFRSGGHWFTTAELDQFAFTSAHRRILQHIIANNGARLRKSNKF
jgi:adenine-specific DNA glycosylase